MANKVTYKSNHPVVIRAAQDAAEVIGKRFGAYVRSTAKQSIKKPGRDGKPAPPGQPPRNKTGALKDFILFAWDAQTRSVVIGPKLLPGRTDAPEALEKGKRTKRNVRIGGKRTKAAVTYEARPFMVPALEKRLPELPGLWKNAIRK